jgi:1-acyl-sn-glycerol-3-phosphate acyltransferase
MPEILTVQQSYSKLSMIRYIRLVSNSYMLLYKFCFLSVSALHVQFYGKSQSV